MSVEIETSALSMFESLDSLRATPLVMHRIQVELHDVQTWLQLFANSIKCMVLATGGAKAMSNAGWKI